MEHAKQEDSTKQEKDTNPAGAREEAEAAEPCGRDAELREDKESGLAEKLEEAKDKLLRKIAEFDNYKKRTAKEKTENFSMGVCDAVAKLLPVMDNLDRAIAAAESNDDKDALLSGIKMVRNQFADALGDIGVSEIEAVGKAFDPEKHNAVMMEDSEEASNTVIDELAKGYIYKSGDNERVIRHSMVKVSNCC